MGFPSLVALTKFLHSLESSESPTWEDTSQPKDEAPGDENKEGGERRLTGRNLIFIRVQMPENTVASSCWLNISDHSSE
jgi:hypothetical protein